MHKLYVKLKVYSFTHFYIIRHDMQLFVTPFFLKLAKSTKNRLKVMEYAAKSHLNVRNTYCFKTLTANLFLSSY